ncbi:hypothetical protein [Armatimonas sp.]|uniref:hypothetical protein n=1 Tax=Armatimonas sp. TaxID=1872638 RepID=UPI00374DF204
MPLQQLAPEEALETVHRAVQPRAHHLKTVRMPWKRLGKFGGRLTLFLVGLLYLSVFFNGNPPRALMFLAGLAMILWLAFAFLVPLIFVCSIVFNLPRERAIAQTTEALSPILGLCCLTESAPLLLDFLVWLEPSAPRERLRSLHAALVRILPRVGEDALQQILTPERRQALRLICDRLENTELAKIALLVLGSVQDRATIPLAQRLRKSPLTSDAAEAFLDAMQATTP